MRAVKTDTLTKVLLALVAFILTGVGAILAHLILEIETLRNCHDRTARQIAAIACALEIQAGGTCWPGEDD